MKKIKIFKTAVVVCTILLALSSTFYADNTSKFTDIDNNWAKQHIISVYNKGLMGGYSETEFKPGEFVRNYDALVSISRMINQEKNINLEQLEKIYRDNVLDKFKVPNYAREHVLVCLGKGIITDADVSKFGQIPYATKNSIIEYLGRAFGIVYDEKDPPIALEFLDIFDIPTRSKPCVKFLLDNGIISPYSETNTKLNPKSNVDRAVFAKMLDISSDVYNRKVLGLDVPDTGAGAADSWGGNIEWADGIGPDPAKIAKDWAQSDLSSAANGEQPYVPPVADGKQPDVTAYVDQVIPEYGNLAVFVGTERRTYKVAENATCTIDDIPGGFWRLAKSDRVGLFIEDNKIVKIIGESRIRKIIGKLISIQSSEKTTLRMETSKGEVRNYAITAKTVVIKDGKNALWQELREGNSLVLTTSYDELIEINADGVKSSDKGAIESITYSRIAPPKIVITASGGGQNTYYADAGIEIAGADGDIHSLRPGMQAEVSLIDDAIKKITVLKEDVLLPFEFKGEIKSINPGNKTITVDIYDSGTNNKTERLIYVSEDTKIADADLNFIGLGSLKPGQTINVRGTGTAEGISAKTIQAMY